MMAEKTKIFTWRGLMGDLDNRTRVMAYLALVIALGALVFCQLGFVPIGSVRLFLVLAPLTVGALMFGTRAGIVLGFVAGLASLIHALFLPFDYYEKFFASPVNSLVLFTLTGLLLGLLFAVTERIGKRGRTAGFIALIISCFIGSWFASTFFQISTYIINMLLNFVIPEELLDVIAGLRGIAIQLVVDGIIMSIVAVIAATIDLRRKSTVARNIHGLAGCRSNDCLYGYCCIQLHYYYGRAY